MKYNINVIKSVWRRLRKPSRATLDAICSKDAVYSEVLSKTGTNDCERLRDRMRDALLAQRNLGGSNTMN
jgi:hypothetical protein